MLVFFLDCLPLASSLYPQEEPNFLWGYSDSEACFPIKRFSLGFRAGTKFAFSSRCVVPFHVPDSLETAYEIGSLTVEDIWEHIDVYYLPM